MLGDATVALMMFNWFTISLIEFTTSLDHELKKNGFPHSSKGSIRISSIAVGKAVESLLHFANSYL